MLTRAPDRRKGERMMARTKDFRVLVVLAAMALAVAAALVLLVTAVKKAAKRLHQ